MISKKTFTIGLLLAAVLAAIGAPLKVLEITYNSFTSPYNTGWNGTSRFIEALEELGYQVEILNSQEHFLGLENGKILYISIAPERPYTLGEIEKFEELMRDSGFRMIFADEKAETANTLLENLFNATLADGYLVLLGSREPIVGYIVEARLPDGRSYKLRLNIPSAFEEVGSLKVLVKVGLPLVIMGGGNVYKYKYGGYPIVCGWFSGDDGVVVLSDSSLFINLYFDYPEISDNEEYVLSLVEWLTSGDREYKIYIDNFHYKPIESLQNKLNLLSLRLPIPPIGLIFAIYASRMLKIIDSWFSTLVSNVLEFKILALAASILLAYYFISRREPITGYDEGFPRFEEVLIVGETPVKRRLASRKVGKKEYKQAISSLYEVLEDLFRRYVGIEVSDLEEYKSEVEKLVGVGGLKTLNLLRKIDRNVKSRKPIIPPIVFWGRTFNRLVRNCEVIVEKFGASILGKEGLESVEYKLRKR